MLLETTRITVNDIRLFAFHGVLPQEKRTGAWYTLTVSVDYPFGSAVESDNIDDTLSYANVLDVVKREMSIPSRLLEHVAGRILSALFADFPMIKQAEVEIRKENPPIGGDTGGATVLLSAKNEKFSI